MGHTKPTDAQLENRFMHHAPQGDQADRYAKIREACCSLAKIVVALTPCSAEQTRALNALDEVMFLANAGIARNETAEARTAGLVTPAQRV